MGFSKKVEEEALIACGRHCVLCHKFCGTKIELHHIVPRKDDGDDSLDNCLPLCFDCHADVMQYNPDHPKGKKYTPSELKKHRENWYKKIKENTGISINSEYKNLDRKTFERVTKLLRSDSIMLLIKNNGFIGGPFSDKILTELITFQHETELPEFEFIDSDLEGLKSELVILFDVLDDYISKYTFGAGINWQGIPSEWEWTQPERLNEAIQKFKEICPQITKSYEALIKLGRRKLYSD